MRLFIASGFSSPLRERIAELKDFAAPRFDGSVKWVEPENIHLTWAFLGEVRMQPVQRGHIEPSARLAAIVKRIDAAAAGSSRIPVELGGFGAFPSLASPKVLWLGVRESGTAIETLARKLSAGLTAEGFVPERGFSAHITIARVKRPLPAAASAEVAAKAKELKVAETVFSVDLMESRLSASGPEYMVVYSHKLL